MMPNLVVSTLPVSEFTSSPKFISDLPSHHYAADTAASVEKVVDALNQSSELPGVLLYKNITFVGALSRWKIFEWLGRPYGVELFFKKPIENLFDSLKMHSEIYASDMTIGEAVEKSLNRPLESMYEPMVISFGDGNLRLLDFDVLILAQSHLLSNANRLIEKQVEIGKILSSTLELPKVLALILEQMDSIIPYSRAAIMLYRNEQMEFAASRGYPADVNMDEARVLVNNSPIFINIINGRRSTIIADATLRDDWQHIPGTPPTRSWLGVPLVQNDKVLGMLSVSRLMVAPFSSEEVDTASMFASQAAIALENAHLYNEVHKFNQQLESQQKSLQDAMEELNRANLSLARRARQLETSNKIGQQITSFLDIKLLLAEVLSIIQSQFNYSWVSVWMMTDSRDALVLEAGTKSSELSGKRLLLNHKGLAGQASRKGEVVFENHVGQNRDFVNTPGLNNVFSEIALPLKFRKDVLGVLDIQSERLNAFSPEDIAALQVTAAQIAVALRNAGLYSELMRLNHEMKPDPSNI